MANSHSDGLVVRTEELSEVLRTWIDKHAARFPMNLGYKDIEGISPYAYIIENSYYPICEKRLWRILKCEHKHTLFDIADSILSAIDQTHALHDGRIVVIPNPLWSMSKWLAWKEEQGCI